MAYASRKLIFEDKLLFGTLGASLVLNIGFSMLRVPPLLPLTEFVLIFCLIGYALRTPARRLWFRSPLSLFVLFWWLFAGISVIVAYPEWGLFAFRSATHAVETAFLLLGIFIGSSYNKRKFFFVFFPLCLLLGNMHILLQPLSSYLQNYSPSISSLAERETYVFFNYMNSALLSSSYLAWLLFCKKTVTNWRFKLFVCTAAIVICLALIQARINYALYPMLFLMVFLLDHKHAKILIVILCTSLLALMIMSVADLKIGGRVGTFSPEFLYQHFLAAFGIIDDKAMEGIAGAANGVDQRSGWWANIITQLLHSPTSLFFGLGQGIPLTDLVLSDGITPVREPHNSVMSILGRYGLVGLAVFMWMHIIMITKLIRNIRISRRTSVYPEYLMLSFFLLATFTIAMVEDTLEKPFNAIWYYFVWGMAITKPASPPQPQLNLANQ